MSKKATPNARTEDPDETAAIVCEVDGQLVLDGPQAMAIIRAINKHNCENTMRLQTDRIAHFKQRLTDRGMTPDQAVVVLLNVDDVHGRPLADTLMPNYDWQQIRNRGEIPFARGLATRDGIQEALETFDAPAARKLADMRELAVVVVDHGVAEVFTA